MKKTHTYLRFLCILFIIGYCPNSGFAQSGCTDPQALNFEANAVDNDGSCVYPLTTYQPTLLTSLDQGLSEASGLAFTNGSLWGNNDSGNPDELYRIDTLNGNILQTLEISDSDNDDWEDLAQSDTHLYIGDFGNNNGNRDNLKIYKIAKNELNQFSATTQKIRFTYEDQVDFTPNNQNHDFDCEAFFFHNNQLHLFSKNWLTKETKYYVLPTTPGEHVAILRGSFDSEGLITGGDISPDGTIVLVGYTASGLTFMWLLFDYPEGDFLAGNKRRIELGSALTNSQLEGVVFKENDAGFLASEAFSVLSPRLQGFTTHQWTKPTSNTFSLQPDYNVSLAPNPIQDRLMIHFGEILNTPLQIEVYNTSGQRVMIKDFSLIIEKTVALEGLSTLPVGQYWIRLQHEDYQYSLPFQKIR